MLVTLISYKLMVYCMYGMVASSRLMVMVQHSKVLPVLPALLVQQGPQEPLEPQVLQVQEFLPEAALDKSYLRLMA